MIKIAAAFDKENNCIAESFLSARCFKIYDIENGSVICSEIVGTMQGDLEQTVGLLGMLDADGIICGRIGNDEESLLDEEGIELYAGYYGDPDDALEFIIGCSC